MTDPQPTIGWHSFRLHILYAIEAAPTDQHGLGLKQFLDEFYGEKINNGRLYPNLDGLVENGFIEKGRYDNRTNSYALTEKGKGVLESDYEWRKMCMNGDFEDRFETEYSDEQ